MAKKKAKSTKPNGRKPWGGSDTCHYCKREFSWKTDGLANANKEVFCNHECFNENIKRSESAFREANDFDSL